MQTGRGEHDRENHKYYSANDEPFQMTTMPPENSKVLALHSPLKVFCSCMKTTYFACRKRKTTKYEKYMMTVNA
jgi:hypothetical protein